MIQTLMFFRWNLSLQKLQTIEVDKKGSQGTCPEARSDLPCKDVCHTLHHSQIMFKLITQQQMCSVFIQMWLLSHMTVTPRGMQTCERIGVHVHFTPSKQLLRVCAERGGGFGGGSGLAEREEGWKGGCRREVNAWRNSSNSPLGSLCQQGAGDRLTSHNGL